MTEGAKAHSTLLRELFKGIVPLLSDRNVPLSIKIIATGLIFLGVSTSMALVVLIADVLTSFAGHQIDARTYLSFLAATLGILLLALSFGARTALRFEEERALEASMQAVVQARRHRRGDKLALAEKK